MADEAEDIGGISVSLGASHARLASDLAEANRLAENWAKQHFQISLGANFQPPAAPQRPAAQAQAPRVVFGSAASTAAQAQNSQTALQRRINEELAKTGERYNAQTGEIEKATAATSKQRQAIAQVRQEATAPIALDFDTAEVQKGLTAILATLTEITAAAQKLSGIPAGPDTDEPTGGGGKKGLKRKNINARDIGTAADPNKVYTFDPAVYEAEDQRREAASARQREQLVQRQIQRAERQAAQNRINPTQLARANAANYLNANPPSRAAFAGIGRTDINSPGYQSDEEIERERGRGRNAVESTAARRARQQAEEQAAVQRRRESFDREQSAATNAAFRQSARVRQFAIDEEQQARQVAARRASITGSGRTSRTLASGLGALFGGTEGRQIEAQAAASQATRQLQSAEKAIEPLDQRIRELQRTMQGGSKETRQFAEEQIKAIQKSDQYRQALLNVNKAVKEDAAAQANLNKISGASSVARNLIAITTAGAAFSVGLKAIDFTLSALGPALGNFVDIQTGFGATSTRVTAALATQTLALRGNADAALAGAEAQAGLSASAADALNSQLKLTTQIKAGAQAQQQASDLFRAGAGVGNAPSGLFGGYGGVGGTSLFAQQLGGGRGFSETVQQDIAGLRGRGGPDLLGDLNNGVSYVTNRGVRDTVNAAGDQQGSPLGTISRVPGGLADLVSSLNPLGNNFLRPLDSSNGGPGKPVNSTVALNVPVDKEVVAYLNNLNDAGKRGAQSLGAATQASYKYTTSAQEIATATRAAAQAGDVYGVTLAQQEGIVVQLGNAVADSGEKYKKALEQFSVGAGIQDPALIARQSLAAERQRERESAASLDTIRAQQAFARPSIIAQANRQQQYSLNTQLPANAALSALANPNVPVGTGIRAANSGEQTKINQGLRESVGLQKQLDDYYAQGKQILIDTYKVPPALLASVESVGKAIASTQAAISNEQAAYQVAQYNFQLQIARRTLSDIGGLTGKNFGAGESYLGVLERQNLALSRQGQLLQFGLSQRQINFQTALAGFQAPGVTPEERQARIEEAKIEASFAQKQLDIQKQMFGNQVQIVDISNLRQGADLARQIGLLLQGRKVTIDTQVAEQRLLRLQQLQQKQVAQVGTYLTKVDTLAASAMGEIQQLEAAAGHALQSLAVDILKQYGIVIQGLTDQLNGTPTPNNNVPSGGAHRHADGGIFNTRGMTRLTGGDVVGEAAGETVAILSHPRAASGFGSNGGGMVYIDIHDNHLRNDSDIDTLTRKVIQAIGRDASLKGLRGIG